MRTQQPIPAHGLFRSPGRSARSAAWNATKYPTKYVNGNRYRQILSREFRAGRLSDRSDRLLDRQVPLRKLLARHRNQRTARRRRRRTNEHPDTGAGQDAFLSDVSILDRLLGRAPILQGAQKRRSPAGRLRGSRLRDVSALGMGLRDRHGLRRGAGGRPAGRLADDVGRHRSRPPIRFTSCPADATRT